MDTVWFEPAGRANAPLEDSDLVIAGLVRNGGRRLRRNIEILRTAFGAARSLHFIVVESDSTDDTPASLAALERDIPNFRAISLGALSKRLPRRTERIAHCRNAYLEALESCAGFDASGYVVVADLDGVNGALDPASVATCFSSQTPWDVCTANQDDFYYDVWALRHPIWSPDDCWASYDALIPVMGPRQALELAVHARMVRLDPDAPMIPVVSAFGGLAIYRAAILSGARYAAWDETGALVCEHVPFHAALAARGCRIVINPRLLNARTTHHAWHKKRIARAMRRLFPRLYRPDPQGTGETSRLVAGLKSVRAFVAR
ncbi:hypothetical protein U0C82_06460 [Fulvimarina sp. 2208YS6-2-32]|uniref:Glycosyltransferase n=1 Tax=Fulvimarina uroteuthidis TaxID=3098149 RepID=A0ABU5I3N3_9HYPH|nr:hypothetical protein [Fulvimarina sp. 2208YS6-2-32]MDY8108786.1 hypothetical protein [Fulvimarina sp. 2208YS6-2-32]